jgi:hypothetical protein
MASTPDLAVVKDDSSSPRRASAAESKNSEFYSFEIRILFVF